jgi:hypothetical protein
VLPADRVRKQGGAVEPQQDCFGASKYYFLDLFQAPWRLPENQICLATGLVYGGILTFMFARYRFLSTLMVNLRPDAFSNLLA